MKTSNILIVAVILLLFISSAATNLTLKKEFEKIDKSDPTYGFERHDLASFSYVKLKGKEFALTEIRHGEKPQIRSIIQEGALKWTVSNDTLIVTYQPSWQPGYADLTGKPSIYIMAHKLAGVVSEEIVTRLRGIKADSLNLTQTGRGMLVFGSAVKKINARVKGNGYLEFGDGNHFADAHFTVSDSSTMEIKKSKFDRLKTEIDSSALVKIPGNLVKSISM